MKKPKPATAGERLEMKRFGISLHDVRTRPVSKRVKAIDRAIARAVRKERERCVWWVLHYNKQSRATTPIKDGWNT